MYGVIQNFLQSLKYRGGWRGLLEHMYTNGDFPFKLGTYMGCDAFGNRYYENRVDYPLGQHRWVEPKDIHNFDSTHIPPEWHGWMSHQNDVTPAFEHEYIEMQMKRLRVGEISHAPYRSNIGMQMPYFNFHGMHNQSQIRSRGYGIGNHVVGLPPGAPDAYYTQPGSPYNDGSIRKWDATKPKNALWKERLEGPDKKDETMWQQAFSKTGQSTTMSRREQAILERGGTLPGRS